eukprot:11345199-Alexandrium_andersonii.AAC.1
MSASLVGSEMCIRDRDNPEGYAGVRNLSNTSSQTWRVVFKQFWNSGVSVSYTHLTLPTICSV